MTKMFNRWCSSRKIRCGGQIHVFIKTCAPIKPDLWMLAPADTTSRPSVRPCWLSSRASMLSWGSKPMRAGSCWASCNSQQRSLSTHGMKRAWRFGMISYWCMEFLLPCAIGSRRWSQLDVISHNKRPMTFGRLHSCALPCHHHAMGSTWVGQVQFRLTCWKNVTGLVHRAYKNMIPRFLKRYRKLARLAQRNNELYWPFKPKAHVPLAKYINFWTRVFVLFCLAHWLHRV